MMNRNKKGILDTQDVIPKRIKSVKSTPLTAAQLKQLRKLFGKTP